MANLPERRDESPSIMIRSTISMQLLLFNLDGMEHTRLRSSQYGHHEPMPNSSSTPEVFGPVPCLIGKCAASRRGPAQLPRVDGLAHPRGRPTEPAPSEFTTLSQYNDRPDEQRYPFVVVVPPNESIPTPSQRVRLRCPAGPCRYPDASSHQG